MSRTLAQDYLLALHVLYDILKRSHCALDVLGSEFLRSCRGAAAKSLESNGNKADRTQVTVRVGGRSLTPASSPRRHLPTRSSTKSAVCDNTRARLREMTDKGASSHAAGTTSASNAELPVLAILLTQTLARCARVIER